MDYFNKLVKQERQHEMALFAVFVLYIIFNEHTPASVAPFIDSVAGRVIVVVLAISVFVATHPLVGVLGLFAAYELIRRSSVTTGTFGQSMYAPKESSKYEEMQVMNNTQPKLTLEEEMVDKLTPIAPNNPSTHDEDVTFQPIMDPLYGAVPVDYDGGHLL